MAYDAARGRVVLFGGGNGLVNALADVWEWDGATWTAIPQPQPANQRPTGRFGHAMVYDAARKRIVVFGGLAPYDPANLVPTDQTWEWSGTTWARFDAAPPPARVSMAMIYDPVAQRILATGGVERRKHPHGGTDLYTSTAIWAREGKTWRELTSDASESIVGGGGIYANPMAFDDSLGRAVRPGHFGLAVLQFVAPDNHGPVIEYLPDRRVFAGDPLSFRIAAVDPDGDPVTYVSPGLPAGARLDPTSGELSWPPTPAQSGVHELTFFAGDGGVCASVDVQVRVDHFDYAGFPAGAVAYQSHSYIYLPAYKEERTLHGWEYAGTVELTGFWCTIGGQNPGKLVAHCSLGLSPWGDAPLDESRAFSIRGPLHQLDGRIGDAPGGDLELELTNLRMTDSSIDPTWIIRSSGTGTSLLDPS
jgi:hypothetical protein